jgi:HEAT repeat protein/beta-lactamase regulating signal transducer with metallopeptidase domain
MSPLGLLDLLAGTLVRGSLILALAFLGVRLLRRRSAAGRYAVWAAAFAGLTLLPALTLALPVLEPPVLGGGERPAGQMAAGRRPAAETTAMPHASAEAAHSLALRFGGERMRSAGNGMTGPADASSADRQTAPLAAIRPEWSRFGKPDWSRLGKIVGPPARHAAPWLLSLWLAGALFVLARLTWDIRRIARVASRAATLRRGPLADLMRQVAADLGVRQPVRIAISRELAVPVTWGFRRPVVLLPAGARHWDVERRCVVLRHELAHIRRGDYAGHLLIELACALHWPNPFAWRAAHRARLEQEQACDDRVLALGTGPIDYAQQLLDIARAFVSPGVPERGALAMAAAATLPERMRSILDVGLDHRPAGRRTLLAVAGAAMLVGMPTAALHPWSLGPREAELIAHLDSTDPVVRRDAVWSLAVRGSSGARAALVERLHDLDPSTRGVAAWGLGKLGDRAALAPLLAALRDDDAHVREMAVLALGDLRDPRAVPALAPLAADPEHGVRAVMTVALREIRGEPAAEALARLVRNDPDAHTRVMAVTALGRFESRGRLVALEAALADSAPEVRATAAWTLATTGSRASVPRLLAALTAESDVEARDAIIHALGASEDPAAVDGLVRALGDSVPQLRESAAHVLGMLDDERAVEPLIAATRDPDHEVRLTAVWALDALEKNR